MIILIRNAQHVGEAKHIVFAGKDVELTPKGKYWANILCEHLTQTQPVAIYSSDFIRAIETVEPLAKKMKLEIKQEFAFRPIDAGEYFGCEYDDILNKLGKGTLSEVLKNPDPSKNYFKGGETLIQQSERSWKRLEEIIADVKDGSIIISTHLTVINCILCKVFEVPLNKFWLWGGRVESLHPSFTTLIYDQCNWHLENYNCVAMGVK